VQRGCVYTYDLCDVFSALILWVCFGWDVLRLFSAGWSCNW